MVYVAPERFRSAGFVNAMSGVRCPLLAVDEAHCISHWGHDFRPDYLRMKPAIEHLGNPQVIALTAVDRNGNTSATAVMELKTR